MLVTRNLLLTCAFATAVAIAPAIPVTAAEPTTARARVTIDNFGEVNPTYFRGAQPETADYAALAAFGIKTVIDLQRDGEANEKQLVEKAGMQFHKIPMTTRVAPTEAQIASFLKIVNDPANQPVYVHCAGGRHRTGVMTAVYRMIQDGWTSDQAFKEMKSYKFGADFLHPEFKRFVFDYNTEPKPASTVPGVLATTIH